MTRINGHFVSGKQIEGEHLSASATCSYIQVQNRTWNDMNEGGVMLTWANCEMPFPSANIFIKAGFIVLTLLTANAESC